MSLGCFKNCHDKICFLLDFIEFAESCALVYWACAFSLLFVNQWRLSNSVTGTNRDNSVILITSLWVNRLLKIIKLIAPVIILFPGKNVCSPCKTVRLWYDIPKPHTIEVSGGQLDPLLSRSMTEFLSWIGLISIGELFHTTARLYWTLFTIISVQLWYI